MAVVACGRNDQALLEKSPSMDSLGIVLNNIMFGYIIDPGYHFPLLVASPAKVGYIHFIGARLRVCVMEDVVVTVALLATGGVGIVHQQGLPMDAPPVLLHGTGVAVPAIHRLKLLGVWKSFIRRIGMTGDTIVSVVD
jgi:hypothetical protein